MIRFIEILAGGITVSCVYAVIALCFNLTIMATGVFNIAVAEFTVLGALVTVGLYEAGVPLILAVAITLVGGAALGWGEYAVVLRGGDRSGGRMASRSPFVITLGVAMLMRGTGQLKFGGDFYGLPSFSGTDPVTIFGAHIPTQSFWVVGMAVVITVATWYVFKYTLWGKAFRSCADNGEAARLVGIDSRKVAQGTFAVGGVLAVAAGIVIAPITFMSYHSGLSLLLYGFMAAGIGGLGKSSGAIVGGLFVGLGSALVAGYVSSLFATAITFSVLLLALCIRPAGLLGSSVDVAERA